jgi:hypothetical protein
MREFRELLWLSLSAKNLIAIAAIGGFIVALAAYTGA